LRGALGEDRRPEPERQLGPYTLREEIARGGMGVVYRAQRRADGSTVALKLLSGGPLADPATRRRFLREAAAAQALDHPAIVRTHDAGEQDGQAYLVMDFIDGETLAASAHRQPASVHDAAALVETISRAVAHAHGRGVLHRDLKPSNVLLDAQGRPHVADFGLARLLDGAASAELTQSGQILGSPAYMSPEQAAGRSSQVGVPSDVYSLGAILYWLLAGRPPFEADSVAELLALTESADPPRPSSFGRPVPRALEAICLKAMEKRPSDRYPTAEALADELAAWRAGRTVAARLPGPGRRLARWCGRHQAISALLAALVVLLGGTCLWWRQTQARQMREAESRRLDEWHRTVSALASARTERQPGHRARSLERVRQAAAVAVTPELRDSAIAILARPDIEPAFPPVRLPDGCTAAAADPSRLRWVAAAHAGRITWISLPDGRPLATLNEAASRRHGDSLPVELELSADGRLCALQSADGTLRVWRLPPFEEAPGQPVEVPPAPAFVWSTSASAANGYAPALSRDGRWICVRAAQGPDHPRGALVAVEAETGAACVLRDAPGPTEFFSVRPGTTVASLVAGNTVRLVDWETGELVREHTVRTRVTCLSWAENGERLAAGTVDGGLPAWSRFDGFLREGTSTPCLAPVVRLHYSASRAALVECADGTVRYGVLGAADEIVSEARLGRALAMTEQPSRLALLTPDNAVQVWQRVPRPFLRYLGGRVNQTFDGWQIDLSPSGRWLMMKSSSHCVLRDTRTWAAAEIARPPDGSAIFERDDVVLLHGTDGWRRAALPPSGPITNDWLATAAGVPSAPAAILATTTAGHLLYVAPDHTLRASPWPPVAGVEPTSWGRLLAKRLPAGSPTGSGLIALSGDGRLAAAGFLEPQGTTVRAIETGAVIRSWPQNGLVAFSPDGRWFLFSEARAHRLFRVADWTEHWSIPRAPNSLNPGPAAFFADGATVAIDLHPQGVRLVSTETGNPLLTLTPPILQPATDLRYHQESDTLLAATPGNQIWLWDLPKLRTALQEAGIAP
jgi:WD40 repeat protein